MRVSVVLTTLSGGAVARAFAENDAHGVFGRVGGQMITGPTWTNVNGFRAALILLK